jgi:hypothetical protein
MAIEQYLIYQHPSVPKYNNNSVYTKAMIWCENTIWCVLQVEEPVDDNYKQLSKAQVR